MKKFILTSLIFLLVLLTACGETTTKTIVVDQNGKVIETKNEISTLVKIGDLHVKGYANGDKMQDSNTGCQYVLWVHSISPYYNADGKVEGCKNTQKEILK